MPDICERIRKIRVEVTGPRGKAAFSKQLGLSASTYDYYESARVPPADVLVRIAEIAGVDLTWLLTGRSPAQAVPASHPAVQRAATLLAEHPNAAPALRAFLEILSASLQFPAKARGETGEAPAAAEPRGRSRRARKTAAEQQARQAATAGRPAAAGGRGSQAAAGAKAEWIPVLGRSAAGVPQFWSEQDDAAGVTTLDDLIERHCERPGEWTPGRMSADRAERREQHVQVVTVRGDGQQEVVEFVAAGELKARYPDAFAVRVDGESMSPFIRHGDLVVVSPSAPAVDGQAAVFQLEGQIGVTCKLYRRTGETVHLIPINEQFGAQSVADDQVRWAFRVVARVRY